MEKSQLCLGQLLVELDEQTTYVLENKNGEMCNEKASYLLYFNA